LALSMTPSTEMNRPDTIFLMTVSSRCVRLPADASNGERLDGHDRGQFSGGLWRCVS
jgi:hypothetical protein